MASLAHLCLLGSSGAHVMQATTCSVQCAQSRSVQQAAYNTPRACCTTCRPRVRLVPILIPLSPRACCTAVCTHKDHGTSARLVFVVYDDIILNKWLLDSIRNSDKEKK